MKKFCGRKDERGWLRICWGGVTPIALEVISGRERNCTPLGCMAGGREVMVGTWMGRPSIRWVDTLLPTAGRGTGFSCASLSSILGLFGTGSSRASRMGSKGALRGCSSASASVEEERTPGKNLSCEAEKPGWAREGLAGREWEEEEDAVSCEKNGGRVKWEDVGGVGIVNLASSSRGLNSECMKGWCVGEGGALLGEEQGIR